jgi:hypothetical protein
MVNEWSSNGGYQGKNGYQGRLLYQFLFGMAEQNCETFNPSINANKEKGGLFH